MVSKELGVATDERDLTLYSPLGGVCHLIPNEVCTTP